MGVPSRFALEYPRRALELIGDMEESARRKDLIGSFGLLAASAVLTIPYERMQARHFLTNRKADGDLAEAFRSLERTPFMRAPFWGDTKPGWWLESRLVGSVEHVDNWADERGQHPMAKGAANVVEKHHAEHVVRLVRNALSHGNVIYLDENAREIADNRMVYMAFLTRYPDPKDAPETYRLLVTKEDDFLHFVKRWALWIAQLDSGNDIVGAALALDAG